VEKRLGAFVLPPGLATAVVLVAALAACGRGLAPDATVLEPSPSVSAPARSATQDPDELAAPPFEPDPPVPVGITAENNEAGWLLMELVEAAPDVYTGVALIGAGTVLVTVPPGVDRDATQRALEAELARAGPGVASRLVVATVPRSLAELNRLKDDLVASVLKDNRYRGQIFGVATDTMRGVAVIIAGRDSAAARIEIKARWGDAVIFRLGGPIQLD
jgi:hypothetical protein